MFKEIWSWRPLCEFVVKKTKKLRRKTLYNVKFSIRKMEIIFQFDKRLSNKLAFEQNLNDF